MPRVEVTQREAFKRALDDAKLPKKCKALSISTGDGSWDLAMIKDTSRDFSIDATDIVDCPLAANDRAELEKSGRWNFKKVIPESPLAYQENTFDLVYHHDVIEHVRKVFLSLSDCYRLLKPGGYLIFSTPNLFRPANLLGIISGRLRFPRKIGSNLEIGDYIHIQEFYEEQMTNIMSEVGFLEIHCTHSYLGIIPFDICISELPTSTVGRRLSHYITYSGRKPIQFVEVNATVINYKDDARTKKTLS